MERLNVCRDSNDKPARAFSDYKVTLNELDMPKGVKTEKLLWP
jgi:hypothetical protein